MSDDNDPAGHVHRKRYGRSDKANARENRNPEFQEGYAKGIDSLAYNPIKIVAAERQIRAQVGDDRRTGFDEWQRGLWASRSQFAAMGIRPKRKKN